MEDERRQRHLAADLAVLAVVKHSFFVVERECVFPFYRYPDSIDQLRRYIETEWRQTRVGDDLYYKTIEAQRAHPEGCLWLREQLAIRILRPVR